MQWFSQFLSLKQTSILIILNKKRGIKKKVYMRKNFNSYNSIKWENWSHSSLEYFCSSWWVDNFHLFRKCLSLLILSQVPIFFVLLFRYRILYIFSPSIFCAFVLPIVPWGLGKVFSALDPFPFILSRKGSIWMRPRNVHRKNVHKINTGIGFKASANRKNYVGSQLATMGKNGINNSANVEHQSLTSSLGGIIWWTDYRHIDLTSADPWFI